MISLVISNIAWWKHLIFAQFINKVNQHFQWTIIRLINYFCLMTDQFSLVLGVGVTTILANLIWSWHHCRFRCYWVMMFINAIFHKHKVEIGYGKTSWWEMFTERAHCGQVLTCVTQLINSQISTKHLSTSWCQDAASDPEVL